MGSMEAEYETDLGYRLTPWSLTLDDLELYKFKIIKITRHIFQ